MRHSDWFDRSLSCGGSYSPEAAEPDGAVLIPGTPIHDPQSIMKSCFDGSETGMLTTEDIEAIEEIYIERTEPPCNHRGC